MTEQTNSSATQLLCTYEIVVPVITLLKYRLEANCEERALTQLKTAENASKYYCGDTALPVDFYDENIVIQKVKN